MKKKRLCLIILFKFYLLLLFFVCQQNAEVSIICCRLIGATVDFDDYFNSSDLIKKVCDFQWQNEERKRAAYQC